MALKKIHYFALLCGIIAVLAAGSVVGCNQAESSAGKGDKIIADQDKDAKDTKAKDNLAMSDKPESKRSNGEKKDGKHNGKPKSSNKKSGKKRFKKVQHWN